MSLELDDWESLQTHRQPWQSYFGWLSTLYNSTPKLACKTRAHVCVFVMKEPTAVTLLWRHTWTCCSISLTVPLQCTDGLKRTTVGCNSQRNTASTWQCGIPSRQSGPEFCFYGGIFFPLPAVPREAIESSTTHGVMDHQRDVGHYCCTSLKLPVSTAAAEIVLQYIFLPLHQMINWASKSNFYVGDALRIGFCCFRL